MHIHASIIFLIRGDLYMKALNNMAFMLLGVAVGSAGLYCYNEFICDKDIKKQIRKAVKEAEGKIENMMKD